MVTKLPPSGHKIKKNGHQVDTTWSQRGDQVATKWNKEGSPSGRHIVKEKYQQFNSDLQVPAPAFKNAIWKNFET